MTGAAAQLSPVYSSLRSPSLVDFPGRIAGVLFLAGCNFRCGFCHNAGLLGQPRAGLPWPKLDEICRRYRDNWVTGIVISGGEPTLAPELPRLVDFLRERGFAVKLDTNGSHPEALAPLLPRLDTVAMDIKCSPDTYPALTGWADTQPLRESVAQLREWGRVEFRTTVIESVHSDDEMRRIGAWLAGAPHYVLQPFVPRDNLPDAAFRDLPATPAERLSELRAIMTAFVERVDVRGTV